VESVIGDVDVAFSDFHQRKSIVVVAGFKALSPERPPM
jgi:hypothetical protein